MSYQSYLNSADNMYDAIRQRVADEGSRLRDKAEEGLSKGLIHNLHIQTLSKIKFKTPKISVTGQGVIEQLFIGPHKPSGFEGILDRITK